MSLSSFDATVLGFNRMVDRRLAAGWDFDPEYGWAAPCGTTADDWEHVHGYPLPEDDDFAAWFSAFHHYDAADAGVASPNPYPNAA